MTGPTDISESTHQPQILIDEWPDGYVETTAWVEVTSEVADPETAVAWIEKFYPADDREEDETYTCDGATTWQRPDPVEYAKAMEGGYGYDEGPWVDAKMTDDGALQFWVVKVVCAA